MSIKAHKEILNFQTEVSQILNLVIRSLYSNKEIFLRELVSNASDAAEKLRFEALTNDILYEKDSDLRIRIQKNKNRDTLIISDNGIGMSRQEVTDTIGTIASSGTKKFIESLTGDESKDSQLIGQFGVGFYSAFIVADQVMLKTRRAGLSPEQGVCWKSDGTGSYSIETIEKKTRGTEIELHLRKDEKEFLESYTIRNIITKFSDHITIPIEIQSEDSSGDESKQKVIWEQINKGTALWMRSKSEIKNEEYEEFYKHIAHDFQKPLAYIHNQVEGKNEYTSLLYIPQQAPFDLWDPNHKQGIKLFVKRVFIMEETDKLIPRYLRFIRGVIDANDLPLNVSREILQHNRKIDVIRSANIKRILHLLEKMKENERAKYTIFWKAFGKVLKEGPGEDVTNRERIANLLQFTTTYSDNEEDNVTLKQYVDRMVNKQERIYYLTADSLSSARNSPHLEIFRKNNIEVLLLTDRIDEWLVSHLTKFNSKQLTSITRGKLHESFLDQDCDNKEKESRENIEKEHKNLIKRMTKILNKKISDIRISYRLIDSPSCLVTKETDMSLNMARVLKQMGQAITIPIPVLEINPNHFLIKKLKEIDNDEHFRELSLLVFEQALLAEGGKLDNPAIFVQRINHFLRDI